MKKKLSHIYIFILILLFLTPQKAISDQINTSSKLRSELKNEQEIEKEFKELKKDKKQFKNILLVVQMALGAFGYGTGPFNGEIDEKTKEAISEYQKNNNLKQTKELDVKTLDLIMSHYTLYNDNPLIPLGNGIVFTDFWDSIVTADGTWTMENDKIAFPIQTTKISCIKQKMQCVSATATKNENYIDVDITYYDIDRWDNYEISSMPNDYLCKRQVFRINRESKSVHIFGTAINKDKDICKKLKIEDQHSKLVDGLSVYRQEMKKRSEEIKKFMRVDPALYEEIK